MHRHLNSRLVASCLHRLLLGYVSSAAPVARCFGSRADLVNYSSSKSCVESWWPVLYGTCRCGSGRVPVPPWIQLSVRCTCPSCQSRGYRDEARPSNSWVAG
ncbi:hypothetical protein BZA05DRAFT_406088 [Tricharina praecox]|uniref:uncharacterized protein n=1 Tax=Tricharina praecox TaxID=43433 RepID=UPI00221EA53C|nr:uncharacterized protein BZA05DRAFT_406088 [Tricharina praecox]KAI5846995.1 hypothetical protein BZA05DRAFT_406088 [Tricharina praecox]